MHYIPNFLYIFFFKYNCSAYPWYCGSCCSPRPGTRKTCVLPEAPKYSTVQELTSSQEGCLTTLVLSLLGRRDLSRNIRPLAVLALTTGCSFYFSPQAFFCGRAAFEMASSGTLRVRKLLPPLCFCCSHIFIPLHQTLYPEVIPTLPTKLESKAPCASISTHTRQWQTMLESLFAL